MHEGRTSVVVTSATTATLTHCCMTHTLTRTMLLYTNSVKRRCGARSQVTFSTAISLRALHFTDGPHTLRISLLMCNRLRMISS